LLDKPPLNGRYGCDLSSRSTALRYLSLAVALAALVTAAPALAADFPEPAPQMYSAAPASGWIVTLKATAIAAPEFEGSDDYTAIAYPSISFRRADAPYRFSAPDDGISFGLLELDKLRVGPVARFRGERDDSGKRDGLDEVDWTIEAGLFAEFWPLEWLRARGEIRYGFNGHEGFVADVGLDAVQHTGAWVLSIGPRVGFGDGAYMSSYFSVSDDEALANSRIDDSFDADAGIRYFGAAASATYQFNEQWSTTLFGSYNHLVGDAADSPIVRDLGSEHQFQVGLSLAYSFGVDW
jgi:MipA family protein